MLPKEQRLNTKDVALVFGLPRKTTHTKYFKVIVAQHKKLSHKKYAIVVSKKVAPLAVVRNKIRRRVYSGVSKMKITPLPPQAIVVQCGKDAVGLDCVHFYKELETVINIALS